MLIDYHVHTNTSVDAVPSVRDYCKKALELGLNEFCITNHYELWSVDDGTYDYALNEEKIEALQKEIKQASKDFGLRIKHGVELGYYEGRHEEIKQLLDKYSFDYVIGSVHIVDGLMISGENVKLDVDKNDLLGRYKRYFQILKQAIEFGFFDCVGHMELPRKEMPQLDFKEYRDMVGECIQAMKRNGIGFEINTGGWRRYQNEQFPRKEILEMLYNSGVRKVTIGSDCHNVSEFGYSIEEGLQVLKNSGFKHVCTFTGRHPEYHKIQ